MGKCMRGEFDFTRDQGVRAFRLQRRHGQFLRIHGGQAAEPWGRGWRLQADPAVGLYQGQDCRDPRNNAAAFRSAVNGNTKPA